MQFKARQKIPNYRRIKSSVEYELALRERFHKNKWFAIHVRENRAGISRLGIIVSKRISPKAVCRNYTKRLIREAFRRTVFAKFAVDIVVRSRRPLSRGSAKDGYEALVQLMSNIQIKCVSC